MFGLIVAGRLVSTNWEQVSPTNVVAEITDADNVNHIVIFLTGSLQIIVWYLYVMPNSCQAPSLSLMAWAELYISVGLNLMEANLGNYLELSTTINLPRYLEYRG